MPEYLCPECGALYNNRGTLSHHRQTKHQGRKWECLICRSEFTRKDSLLKHMKKCQPKAKPSVNQATDTSDLPRQKCQPKAENSINKATDTTDLPREVRDVSTQITGDETDMLEPLDWDIVEEVLQDSEGEENMGKEEEKPTD